MSFNPFDPIRKYQKTFLAAACILCMVVFIFSFGPGDLFQTLLGRMANSGQGSPVTKVGGQMVTTGDLDRVRRLRERANEFMIQACSFQYAKQEARDRERANTPNATPQTPEEMERSQNLQAFAQWAQSPFLFGSPTYFGDNLTQNADNLDWLVWQQEADRLGIQLSDRDLALIFNRETSTKNWWEPGKDITLIPGLEGFFSEERALRDMGASEVLEILRQEFRVLLAKESLLGLTTGPRLLRDPDFRRSSPNFGKFFANPLAPTPAEFKEYFNQQRTMVNALVLPLDTASFLSSEGVEKPSEETLRTLFESGKDREADASMERPGFKIPRKVQVAYVTSTNEKPWFKTAVARFQALRVLAPITSAPGGPAAALGSLWTWVDPTDAVSGSMGEVSWIYPLTSIGRRDELIGAYDQRLRTSRIRGGLLESWLTAPIDQVHATNATRALPIATLVAANIAPMPGVGSLVGADALWKGSAARYEIKERLPLIAQSRLIGLSPMQPLGGILPTIGAIASVLPSIPKSLDEKNIGNQLMPEIVNLAAREDAEATWKRLKADIAAFKGKTDKAEAETFIASEVKRLGLTYKVMTAPKDRFDLAKDPALDPFRSAYDAKNFGSTNVPPFATKFFQTQGTYDPQGWASNMQENSPFFMDNWTEAREPFLYWRVEDQRPQARTFEQAKADVEKYWLVEKYAVPRAREKAMAIAAEANGMLPPEDKAKADPKKKYWATTYRDILPEAVTFLSSQKISGKPSAPFELENVTRLIPQKTTNPFQPLGYDPYQFQASQIPFPRENFLDQILGLTKPGQAAVLRDRPGSTFYVVVLLSRTEPSPLEFQTAFERAGADFNRDDLWNRAANENRIKFDLGSMKIMRGDATGGNIDSDGRIKIPTTVEKPGNNSDS